MTTLFAETALLPDGWADNVLVEIDKDGWIVGVDSFKIPPKPNDEVEIIHGPLIPGMANIHSHAFQRAMAGMAERASGKKDTFWSWRETMYRFLAFLEPEDMQAVTAQAYVDMLKAGYTSVGEFHYIHHHMNGQPYENRSVMSQEVIQAALETGIAITHMPSLYAYGGFGEKQAAEGQRRFINAVPDLMRIIEELHGEFKNVPQVTLGLAHHSLRAVSPAMLHEGTTAIRRLLPEAPIHIHAAEQMGEVEACLEWSRKRPVEWLLENGGIDDKWCLIHCTHVNDDEVRGLAKSGAVAGLCPTTEANLGDGIFPLVKFFHEGGRFAIGSDSHITVSVIEELRWLEYIQRLVYRERTLIKDHDIPSVGAALYDRCLSGGGRALGRKSGQIDIGHRADLVVLDKDLPFMTGKLRDHILDAAIFAANQNPVKDVMSGGRWVVKNRHHKREEHILEKFRKVMAKVQ
ncbi:MAG TPA: formimidoylglutamate deiminase [Patescibacteria group bacterium]|nr:formimidoylglutamate deiminase [Patescibacteria group bacterium]